MRFTVYDLGDKGRRLTVEWATWRATLELLHRDHVIDKPDLNRLVWRLGGIGSSIPQAQATKIADHLKKRVIPTLSPGEVVHVDGEPEFDAVTGGTTFGPVQVAGASGDLRLEWLEQFAEFCSRCKGLGALQEGAEHHRPPHKPSSA
jgi:hypothetical protein